MVGAWAATACGHQDHSSIWGGRWASCRWWEWRPRGSWACYLADTGRACKFVWLCLTGGSMSCGERQWQQAAIVIREACTTLSKWTIIFGNRLSRASQSSQNLMWSSWLSLWTWGSAKRLHMTTSQVSPQSHERLVIGDKQPDDRRARLVYPQLGHVIQESSGNHVCQRSGDLLDIPSEMSNTPGQDETKHDCSCEVPWGHGSRNLFGYWRLWLGWVCTNCSTEDSEIAAWLSRYRCLPRVNSLLHIPTIDDQRHFWSGIFGKARYLQDPQLACLTILIGFCYASMLWLCSTNYFFASSLLQKIRSESRQNMFIRFSSSCLKALHASDVDLVFTMHTYPGYIQTFGELQALHPNIFISPT